MQRFTGHAYLHRKNRDLVRPLEEVLKKMKAEGLFAQYRERSGYETLFAEDGSIKQIGKQND
ncbi:MAG: hypothetical protein GY765_23475 [bacterium]|nr:hypothetical protein [bacterium]